MAIEMSERMKNAMKAMKPSSQLILIDLWNKLDDAGRQEMLEKINKSKEIMKNKEQARVDCNKFLDRHHVTPYGH